MSLGCLWCGRVDPVDAVPVVVYPGGGRGLVCKEHEGSYDSWRRGEIRRINFMTMDKRIKESVKRES